MASFSCFEFPQSSFFFRNATSIRKAGAQFQSASAGTRMADVEQRFFCHQCSVEIPRLVHGASMPGRSHVFFNTFSSGWLQTSLAQHAILVSWYNMVPFSEVKWNSKECTQSQNEKNAHKNRTGFIEELGQDAAPPVPPPEGPFQQPDDEPFDQLGQVLHHLFDNTMQMTRFWSGAWSPWDPPTWAARPWCRSCGWPCSQAHGPKGRTQVGNMVFLVTNAWKLLRNGKY